MPPLTSDEVLRAEANTVHPDQDRIEDTVGGKELYRALHARNSSALCLSGGGIRSASFALGVIEALAVHPRPDSGTSQGDTQAGDPSASYLCQLKYLSTVSGGGYIGSWLSAWIARSGYAHVWPELTGRRVHPEKEPSEISWLRAYSNYLTPRIGLLSADTWAGLSLYVRNLILNWLVILPALCIALLAVKTSTILAFWLSALRDLLPQIEGNRCDEGFAHGRSLGRVIAATSREQGEQQNRIEKRPIWNPPQLISTVHFVMYR